MMEDAWKKHMENMYMKQQPKNLESQMLDIHLWHAWVNI